jgi:hypothetical protein
MTKPPNPGSDEAAAQGCLCPRLDNGCGKGANGDPTTFWVNQHCPLHNVPAYDALLRAVGAKEGEAK